MKGEPFEPRRVIVVIGDGHDNASKKNIEEVLEIAQRNLVTIYGVSTVAFGFNSEGEKNLTKLAEETGGRVEYPLEGVYKDVIGYLEKPSDEGNYAMKVGTGGYAAQIAEGMFRAIANVAGEVTTQYIMRYIPTADEQRKSSAISRSRFPIFRTSRFAPAKAITQRDSEGMSATGHYTVLQAALPGAAPENIGVLLVDDSGSAHVKIRRDLRSLADEDDAEYLEALQFDLRQKASELGGESLMQWLIDNRFQFPAGLRSGRNGRRLARSRSAALVFRAHPSARSAVRDASADVHARRGCRQLG